MRYKSDVPPGHDSSDGSGQMLRTGCIPDLALQRLQSLVGALNAFDPDLEPRVTRLRSAAQLERLRAGDLDLGIVHGSRIGPGIAVEPLFRGEPLTVILPVGHPLAARPSLGAGDLRGEVLLTFPRAADPALHDDLTEMVFGAGLEFRAVREYGEHDPRDVLLAVAEGRGVTLAPLSTMEIDGEMSAVLERVALEPLLRMPDTLLAWRRDPPDAVRPVIDAARAAAHELHASS
jgi:DNA-binding transcriptional LysR family regulator